jgi:hypothetical protein
MALNQIFKEDNWISLNVGLEHSAGDPVKVGDLVGVCVTGSGSASPIVDEVNAPGYNGGKRNGVGNKPGFASVALTGGWKLNIPSAIRPVAAGDTLYITSGGALTKTASGNTRFGKVTHIHPDGDDTTAVVKIVQ